MAEPVKRYYVRLQLVEQTGFDDDTPQIVVLDSTVLAPPSLREGHASILYNSLKNIVGVIKNLKEYVG